MHPYFGDAMINVMLMLANWLQKNIKRQIPQCCHLCGLSLDSPHALSLCSACRLALQPTPRCQRCGLTTAIPTKQCGRCLKEPPWWQALYCIGDYRYPLTQYIHQLKYQRQFWLAKPLAQQLSTVITEPAPVLCAVPMHWRRYLWRGFNQSDQLAKQLAQHLQVQYWPHLFHRQRATAPQKGLHRKQRRHNLYGAFGFTTPIYALGSHVAIIDDVVTTGSTLKPLCQLLTKVGVTQIDVYCLCRTPEPSEP
ncbi:DNA utilization protein GntX [Vibrio palustris]|uniref:DNA utilization protein GntX n=2 Tax=Vibrio palustris TaxID=1918946 RepID=A0A1R4B787_9VIBR|nr:DNA utilization protein GntX [Vibrio palustris]